MTKSCAQVLNKNLALWPKLSFQICTKLSSTRFASIELASTHARVTSIKSTKQQSVSESVADKGRQWSNSGQIKSTSCGIFHCDPLFCLLRITNQLDLIFLAQWTSQHTPISKFSAGAEMRDADFYCQPVQSGSVPERELSYWMHTPARLTPRPKTAACTSTSRYPP